MKDVNIDELRKKVELLFDDDSAQAVSCYLDSVFRMESELKRLPNDIARQRVLNALCREFGVNGCSDLLSLKDK